jgi:hypothetical protein
MRTTCPAHLRWFDHTKNKKCLGHKKCVPFFCNFFLETYIIYLLCTCRYEIHYVCISPGLSR